MPKMTIPKEIKEALNEVQAQWKPLKSSQQLTASDHKRLDAKQGVIDLKDHREEYEKNCSMILDFFILNLPESMETAMSAYDENATLAAAVKLGSLIKSQTHNVGLYMDEKTAIPTITCDIIFRKMELLEFLFKRIMDYVDNNTLVTRVTREFAHAAIMGESSLLTRAVNKRQRLPETTRRLDEYAKAHQLERKKSAPAEQKHPAEILDPVEVLKRSKADIFFYSNELAKAEAEKKQDARRWFCCRKRVDLQREAKLDEYQAKHDLLLSQMPKLEQQAKERNIEDAVGKLLAHKKSIRRTFNTFFLKKHSHEGIATTKMVKLLTGERVTLKKTDIEELNKGQLAQITQWMRERNILPQKFAEVEIRDQLTKKIR